MLDTCITAKSNYFHTKLISDCGEDTKSLYRIMYDLIGREKSTQLPASGCLDKIAEAFSTYFDNKIQLMLDQAAFSMTTSSTLPTSHSAQLQLKIQ